MRDPKPDRIAVSLSRLELRLQGATGLVGALQMLAEKDEDVPCPVLDAVVNALAFHLEQLCFEFELDGYGRRP